MRVDAIVMQRFFQETVDSVIEHVANLLREPTVNGCAAIVMVGGFSESPMLQETVRKKFPSTKIIVPDEAGLAVLKGAVIYGHRPREIAARISKITYGVMCNQTFVPGRHPESRKVKNDEGEYKVNDVFNIYVKAGQSIGIDEEFKDTYTVAKADQDGMSVVFYQTTDPNPSFVDEPGCSVIATMQLDVPGYGKDRGAEVAMKFGRTEIEATGVVKQTGQKTQIKLNFLG